MSKKNPQVLPASAGEREVDPALSPSERTEAPDVENPDNRPASGDKANESVG